LLVSGFYITATYPVRSEMRASTHLHEIENISYDMIFVCRKRDAAFNTITWSALRAALVKSVNATTRNLQINGQSTSRQDVFAIVLGKWLQLYSKYYPNVTKENNGVDPSLALSLIERDIVSILQEISMGSL